MPTLANDLVLFLMSLFGNEKAAKDFLDDPEKALEDHGLGDVCSADVDAAMPVILDFAPINTSSFDRTYNTGSNAAATGGGGGGGAGAVAVTPPPAAHSHGDHAHAVQQLHNVVNNYSYSTEVDDRDTITDQSVNQNIWAEGDVEQLFDNDSVVASGDRAVAAGDDVDMENSNNIEDSYNTDNSNDSSTDNSVDAGRDANIGNEETEVQDSFNTDVDLDVSESFNDESDNSVDNSEETNVDFNESFNDNSVDVADVGNTETNHEVAVTDSFTNEETTTTEAETTQIVGSFNPVEVDVEENFSEENTTITETQIDTVTNVAEAGEDAAAG